MEGCVTALVVMGVSGCGKSSVGGAISSLCDGRLIEGDAFHPAANLAKMRAGIPLTDEDRAGWLSHLGKEISSAVAAGERPVLACSALKKRYRDTLREYVAGLGFVFLDLTPELAMERVTRRENHYMPASLVRSQFEALETPHDEQATISINAALRVDDIAHCAVDWWRPKMGSQQRIHQSNRG